MRIARVTQLRCNSFVREQFTENYPLLYAVFVITGYASLGRDRKALRWTIIFTTLLFISLGGSLVQLIRQAKLEAVVERVLVNRTVTFLARGID